MTNVIATTLIVVSCATLSSPSRSVAADAAGTVRKAIHQIVEVRNVRAESDRVSGVLVNLSSARVHHVRVRIDRAWLWANERHPGEAADNPGRSDLYTVPGDIAAGGQLIFSYQQDTALPQRIDGRFETSVSVVGLEQAG